MNTDIIIKTLVGIGVSLIFLGIFLAAYLEETKASTKSEICVYMGSIDGNMELYKCHVGDGDVCYHSGRGGRGTALSCVHD